MAPIRFGRVSASIAILLLVESSPRRMSRAVVDDDGCFMMGILDMDGY